MTRGWRWETENEYVGRMSELPESFGPNTVLTSPTVFKASYDAQRRRLCKACGGPVEMLPCPYHRPKGSPVRPSTHLICPACGTCVDDLEGRE